MKDLTNGKEWKSILMFSLPMIAGNLFQQLYNMVDGIVVGRYVGTQAFSAVGSAFSMTFLIIALMMGVSGGMSIIISQLYGAKKYDQIEKAVSTMYVLGVGGGIVCSVIGFFCVDFLLKYVLAIPSEIFDMASGYLKILMAGLIFLAVYNVISAIFRALGDSKTPLKILIVSTVVNIVLDVYFVAVLGWGVNGVAYATVIAQAVSCFQGLFYAYRNNKLMKITAKNFAFDMKIFNQSLRLGLPAGLQQMLVSVGIMAVQRLINSFGVDTMAAYTAGSRIEQLVNMPMMQLQMALSTFVGQNIGANKVERAQTGYKATRNMMIIWSVIGGIMLVAGAKLLVSIFVPEASGAVFEQGIEYLQTIGLALWIFCFMGSTGGLLRGAGDVLFPTIVTIVAFVVRIVFSYTFAPIYGPVAIWIAMPVGWVFGSIISVWRYKSGKWKKMGLLGRLESGKATQTNEG